MTIEQQAEQAQRESNLLYGFTVKQVKSEVENVNKQESSFRTE